MDMQMCAEKTIKARKVIAFRKWDFHNQIAIYICDWPLTDRTVSHDYRRILANPCNGKRCRRAEWSRGKRNCNALTEAKEANDDNGKELPRILFQTRFFLETKNVRFHFLIPILPATQKREVAAITFFRLSLSRKCARDCSHFFSLWF